MAVTLCGFVILLLTCLSVSMAIPVARKHPIILVPGDAGSQLEVKVNKSAPLWYCMKFNRWTSAWINLELLVPYVIDCWAKYMTLEYDVNTRTTRNPTGVEVRVPGWGETSTVEFIDPSKMSVTAYYYHIVQFLVDEGYERGKSIRAAPFDFRKGPNELTDFFENLVHLIEDTYKINDETSSVIVCHSMGCPLLVHFLANQSQQWKDRYVKSIVTLGAAWKGSVKAIRAFATGENLGVKFVNPQVVRPEERSSPSLTYLLPSESLWGPDEVLIETPNRNYTANDYEDFFVDIGFLPGYEMYLDVKPYKLDERAPGVEVHCLYGQGIPTSKRFIYDSGFPDTMPLAIPGDGDGSVNIRSLKYCSTFSSKQTQKVHVKPTRLEHMDIVKDPEILNYIKDVAAPSQ